MRRRRVVRRLAAGLAGLLAPFVASGAHAAGPGYQVDHFEPPPVGDPFIAVESPWYSSTRPFAAGLSLDYARNLLISHHTDASGAVVRDAAPIGHELTGRLDVAGSLFDRAALTLSAPLVFQSGTRLESVGPTGMAAGDPRIGLRGRIYGQPDAPLSISASTYLWIPVGEEKNLTGDAGPRFLWRGTAGGLVWNERVRWGFNAGYLGRRTARLSDVVAEGNTVGSELQAGAALNYVMLDRRLSFGPEATLAVALANTPVKTQKIASVELFGAAHYLLADTFLFGAGAGVGLAGEPGPPDFRLLFSFAYAPVRRQRAPSHGAPPPRPEPAVRRAAPPKAQADRDGDGVPDASDACPTRPGAASDDPVRTGCPAREKVVLLPDADGHVGAVEIDDGHTKVLLDQAYASAEIGLDGTLSAVPSEAPKVIANAVAPMATDTDHDGVLDVTDACPDRPGPRAADAPHNGCPKAVERVVVLPDENGHVGAVEVDDGTTKTLVDSAYGSVELGDDHRSRALVAESGEVARTFGRAMAARPPGARMIIFFTARAEPVRDLDGPIDTLAAEINEKAGAMVDVVGHTDEVGAHAVNKRIGLARAKLIADRLVAAGIPRDRIRTSSKGDTEPAVRSRGANVAELRNRRVEVFLH